MDKQQVYQELQRLLVAIGANCTETALFFWYQDHETFEPLLEGFLSNETLDESKPTEEFLTGAHRDVLSNCLSPEILAPYYAFACDMCVFFLKKYEETEMASHAVSLSLMVINEAASFLPSAPPQPLDTLLTVFCEVFGSNGGAGVEGLMQDGNRPPLTVCRLVKNPVYTASLPHVLDFVTACLPCVARAAEFTHTQHLQSLVVDLMGRVKSEGDNREATLEESALCARVLAILCGEPALRDLFLGLVEEKDVFEIVAAATTAQVSAEKTQVFFSFFFSLEYILTKLNRPMRGYSLPCKNYSSCSHHNRKKGKIYFEKKQEKGGGREGEGEGERERDRESKRLAHRVVPVCVSAKNLFTKKLMKMSQCY